MDSVAIDPGSRVVIDGKPISGFYAGLGETFLLPREPKITITSETGGFGAGKTGKTPRMHVAFEDAGFLPEDCFEAFPDEVGGETTYYSGRTLTVGKIVTARSRGWNLSVTAQQNAPSGEVAWLFLKTLAELEEAYQNQDGFQMVISDLKQGAAELSAYPGRKALANGLDAARANPGAHLRISGHACDRYVSCGNGLVPNSPIIFATSKPAGYGAVKDETGLPRLYTSFWGNSPGLMEDLWEALPETVLGEEVVRHGWTEIAFGNVAEIRRKGRDITVTASATAPSRHVVNLFCKALQYVDSEYSPA
ncbi:MAG: hypothetical protein V1820_06485 [archaeon]